MGFDELVLAADALEMTLTVHGGSSYCRMTLTGVRKKMGTPASKKRWLFAEFVLILIFLALALRRTRVRIALGAFLGGIKANRIL
jgi:hypothetical protein